MEPETPPRNPSAQSLSGTPVHTPINRVLQRVDQLTPTRHATAIMSPFGSPALRRLDEDALRDRLRDAYFLLKEKEKNLFLAATVGQELVEANQQLEKSYEEIQAELEAMRSTEHGVTDEERSHGRRRSMHQNRANTNDDRREGPDDSSMNDDREKQWMRVHVQPLKTRLDMALELTDSLSAERENLAAQVYGLKQEQAAALRRASDSAASAEESQRRVEFLEEDKAQLQQELDEQRVFWARRWAEHQANAREVNVPSSHRAEDAAARIRAEQRADATQMRLNASLAEVELLRTQMQRLEDERVECEPLRARWLSSEEALLELQDTHQTTCDALAQAEAQLAEFDRMEIDPVSLKSDKTSTSLLGELDQQRHRAVTQQQALAREHVALKRAYTRAMGSQARMKQQVARLTQLAATGASETRMRRLEAALGEAECQRQALLWASMGQRRLSPDSEIHVAETDGTALVMALRAKLKVVTDEREQAHRELRTAHLLRANEVQRTREIEREAADTESKLRRAVGDLSALRADHDALKRAVKSGKKQVHSPRSPHKPPDQPDVQQPPRKRTCVGLKENASPTKGPMSLAFVINSEAANTQPSPTSSHSSNQPLTSDSTKRRPATPSGIRAAKRKLRMTSDTAPVESGDISDIKQAADRGLKSWLGTLGAVHASATIGDHHVGDVSTSEPSGSSAVDVKPEECATSTSTTSDGKPAAPVDEIYVTSRMSQKPIECNNQ
ncbi:hypothetical protein H4R27_004756 [Coemansia aciculifera]|nr:hypothetical protein H4R27_004756 [Coemansia aciculifera]